MRLKCSNLIRTIFTIIMICLFLFRGLQTYKRIYRQDLRVVELGMIQKWQYSQNSGFYLRRIDNRFKMQNFELIQIMNQANTNEINDYAILIISASVNNLIEHSYVHLLKSIEKNDENNNKPSFFVLRKNKTFFLQNQKEINSKISDIQLTLQYFIDSLFIKKLTILSYEEGSLLCLRTLTHVKYHIFPVIDKLILINPFNSLIMILQSNSKIFLQQTKRLILSDPIRTNLVNNTRIIIIHTTIDNNYEDEQTSWIFQNNIGEKVIFANSLIISSKSMWNVYSFLNVEEYFKFQPFNEIISKLIIEDIKYGLLSIKSINYLLLYSQVPRKKQLNLQIRHKVFPKCVDFYMQNRNRNNGYFKNQCIRVLRKEDFYFNQNTTIVIKSEGKFQIYGENYERLLPYNTKGKQIIYLLQNVHQYRKFFIINSKKYLLQLIVQPLIGPNNMIKNVWQNKTTLNLKHKILINSLKPIKICSGTTILYPQNYLSVLFANYNTEFQHKNDCFNGIDLFAMTIKNLQGKWNLGFNLIIFNLFCFHIVKKSTFTRFYYQLLVNYTLTFFHTGQSLLCDNLIIMAIVVVIEQFLKFVLFISDMINMPKNLAVRVLWISLLFEILKWFDINIFFSPWKTFGLLFFGVTHKHNIVVLFVEFLFIMDYVIMDISHTQGLVLCCAWLTSSSFEENQQQKHGTPNNDVIPINRRLKSPRKTDHILNKQIINTITICTIALFLSQGGILLHNIIDLYITTNAILAIAQQI